MATMVAELRVTWPNGYQDVKQFDNAWQLGMEISETDRPVNIKLLRWVRKD